jgi:hypothetical protein
MTVFAPFESRPRLPLISRPGAIGVVSGNRGTYWEFSRCLLELLAKMETPCRLIWKAAAGGALAMVRNQVVDEALKAKAEWLWFIDDDHTFEANTLARLLRHDVDIVVPLVSRRDGMRLLFPPPRPLVPTMTDEDLVQQLAKEEEEEFITQACKAERRQGLIEMRTCGTAGMLVRAEVFRAIPTPWFEFGKLPGPSGCEDTWFTLLARRAGFRIWCDTETRIGHLTTCAVWPVRQADGSYRSRLMTGENLWNGRE